MQPVFHPPEWNGGDKCHRPDQSYPQYNVFPFMQDFPISFSQHCNVRKRSYHKPQNLISFFGSQMLEKTSTSKVLRSCSSQVFDK